MWVQDCYLCHVIVICVIYNYTETGDTKMGPTQNTIISTVFFAALLLLIIISASIIIAVLYIRRKQARKSLSVHPDQLQSTTASNNFGEMVTISLLYTTSYIFNGNALIALTIFFIIVISNRSRSSVACHMHVTTSYFVIFNT